MVEHQSANRHLSQADTWPSHILFHKYFFYSQPRLITGHIFWVLGSEAKNFVGWSVAVVPYIKHSCVNVNNITKRI